MGLIKYVPYFHGHMLSKGETVLWKVSKPVTRGWRRSTQPHMIVVTIINDVSVKGSRRHVDELEAMGAEQLFKGTSRRKKKLL